MTHGIRLPRDLLRKNGFGVAYLTLGSMYHSFPESLGHLLSWCPQHSAKALLLSPSGRQVPAASLSHPSGQERLKFQVRMYSKWDIHDYTLTKTNIFYLQGCTLNLYGTYSLSKLLLASLFISLRVPTMISTLTTVSTS